MPLVLFKGACFACEKEFFDFLRERQGLLEGVVICGGEPTINKDLPQFIKKIKNLGPPTIGFAVKLDTNGSNLKMLKDLVNLDLLDYVAMDIKTTKQKYPRLFAESLDIKNIEESVEFLKTGKIDFEFRTTVVPGVHSKEDFVEIAKWIGGKNVKYYLQNFRPEKTIDPEFEKLEPYKDQWLKEVAEQISPYFKFCQVR